MPGEGRVLAKHGDAKQAVAHGVVCGRTEMKSVKQEGDGMWPCG